MDLCALAVIGRCRVGERREPRHRRAGQPRTRGNKHHRHGRRFSATASPWSSGNRVRDDEKRGAAAAQNTERPFPRRSARNPVAAAAAPITKASACQGAPVAPFAAPPGRSSSLRCGRSSWTSGVAGGMEAAIKRWPVLPRARARAGPDAAAAGCWPQPHPRPRQPAGMESTAPANQVHRMPRAGRPTR